jgi:hypothetical protein
VLIELDSNFHEIDDEHIYWLVINLNSHYLDKIVVLLPASISGKANDSS